MQINNYLLKISKYNYYTKVSKRAAYRPNHILSGLSERLRVIVPRRGRCQDGNRRSNVSIFKEDRQHISLVTDLNTRNTIVVSSSDSWTPST